MTDDDIKEGCKTFRVHADMGSYLLTLSLFHIRHKGSKGGRKGSKKILLSRI